MVSDQEENALIELYLAGDWTTLEGYVPHDYVYKKLSKDPLGRNTVLYTLNPAGRIIANFLMRKHGHQVGPERGVALERRKWVFSESSKFSERQMKRAFRKFSEMSKCPVKFYRDSHHRLRVVFQDIDMALSRVSSKVKWETHREFGETYLKGCGFTPAMIWLWIKVFDPHRKELRDIPHYQEFVVWEDTSRTMKRHNS